MPTLSIFVSPRRVTSTHNWMPHISPGYFKHLHHEPHHGGKHPKPRALLARAQPVSGSSLELMIP